MNLAYKKYIPVILIIILGFAVYGSSINGMFIWDDKTLIKDNADIKDWRGLSKIFAEPAVTGPEKHPRFYRPLQMFTYILDHLFWKSNVIGYHITNIILHIAVTLALYRLIVMLFGSGPLSLITSLLFLLHPVHCESVAYISGRAEPLAAFFMLSSFILYIRYLDNKKRSLFLGVIALYALALLSKESVVIFPVLLLAYHAIFKKRAAVKVLLSLSAIACACLAAQWAFLGRFLPHLYSATTFFQRMPGFFAAISRYTRILFLPFGLHMEYGNTLFKLTDPNVIIGIVILSLLSVYTIKKRKNPGLISFAILWFFITLLPQSNLYPVNAYMAEHWLYLPSIAFFIIMSKYLTALFEIRRARAFAVILVVSLLAFYASLTVRQSTYWREPIGFYKRTLRYVPDSARVYYNLGHAYGRSGRKEESAAAYRKAIKFDPGNPDAYNNLGVVYWQLGRKEDAVEMFKRAVEIDPAYPGADNINIALKKMEEGAQRPLYPDIKKEKGAENPKKYLIIGNFFASVGQDEDAIKNYKKAIELDPAYVKAYNNIGAVYAKGGRYEEALSELKKALEVKPGHAETYNNLSATYCDMGEYDLAVEYCDKALKLGYKVKPELLKRLKIYRGQRTKDKGQIEIRD